MTINIENSEDEFLEMKLYKLNSLKRHPYYHEGKCIPHDCKCNDKDKCTCINKRQKCKYGYRYFCIECNYGINGMYSCCTNDKCTNFKKSICHISS